MEKNEQYNIGKLHSKKQVLKSGDVIKMDDIHEENQTDPTVIYTIEH